MGAILAFVIGNCISQECFLPTFKVEQGRYNRASPIFLARPMTHMIVDCRSGFVGCAPDQNEGISDGATINSNTNGPRGVCAIKSLNAPKKRKKKNKKKPTQPSPQGAFIVHISVCIENITWSYGICDSIRFDVWRSAGTLTVKTKMCL